MRFKRVTS
ncbi:hypothetical protein D047_2738A, partial [Vibrio parahaemolyticus VPTS-2010_2]